MKETSSRELHIGHFAFMRSLAQGLDERDSWERYLRLEGEHSDVRTVRRTITWIRDLFAAAAHREQRPGTARLVRLDPRELGEVADLPSLELFAADTGGSDRRVDNSAAMRKGDCLSACDRAAAGGNGGGWPDRGIRVQR